jgi:hypothetical protein
MTNSFAIQQVQAINSTCNFGGQIIITLVNTGSGFPFNYSLYDQNNQLLINRPNELGSYTFSGLSSGTYTYSVTDSNNVCTYTDTLIITNDEPFNVITSQTGTTCGFNNGSLNISVTGTGLTSTYEYLIIGNSFGPLNALGTTSYTQTNLASGSYYIKVTDSNGCYIETTEFIDTSVNIDFTLFTNYSPIIGDSSITAYITQGEPPFTLYWSPNVNGQTGLTVSNLLPDTYTLTIVDSFGCIKTKSVNFQNYSYYSASTTVTICNNTFGTPTPTRKGILQMFIEGYQAIISQSGATDCVLTSATFTTEVTISGTTYPDTFFATNTFYSIPSDNMWVDSVETLLESIYGIGPVDINILDNNILIQTDCSLPGALLSQAPVSVGLVISYGLACYSATTC